MSQKYMVDNFKFLTGRENPYLENYQGHFVHQKIIKPLQKLQTLAQVEIGAELKIISAFRNFERQAVIWNEKCKGKRTILDDQGKIISPEKCDTNLLVNSIMRFSALPGASRHHWGTDIDIYDENKLDKKLVKLTPDEALTVFSELNSWLDEKIANNQSFGFYRPYNQERGGVSVEKWHLSYAPISYSCFENYTLDLFVKNIEQASIEHQDFLLKNAEEIFNKFVTNIDEV